MNSGEYSRQFQAFGKVIKYADFLTSQVADVETAVEEIASEMLDDYAPMQAGLSLALSNGKTVISALQTAANGSKNIVSGYLTGVTKTALGSSATTVGGILTDLNSDMNSNNETVLISGHFYNYFNTNYNVQLNSTAGVPSISEAWAE